MTQGTVRTGEIYTITALITGSKKRHVGNSNENEILKLHLNCNSVTPRQDINFKSEMGVLTN